MKQIEKIAYLIAISLALGCSEESIIKSLDQFTVFNVLSDSTNVLLFDVADNGSAFVLFGLCEASPANTKFQAQDGRLIISVVGHDGGLSSSPCQKLALPPGVPSKVQRVGEEFWFLWSTNTGVYRVSTSLDGTVNSNMPMISEAGWVEAITTTADGRLLLLGLNRDDLDRTTARISVLSDPNSEAQTITDFNYDPGAFRFGSDDVNFRTEVAPYLHLEVVGEKIALAAPIGNNMSLKALGEVESIINTTEARQNHTAHLEKASGDHAFEFLLVDREGIGEPLAFYKAEFRGLESRILSRDYIPNLLDPDFPVEVAKNGEDRFIAGTTLNRRVEVIRNPSEEGKEPSSISFGDRHQMQATKVLEHDGDIHVFGTILISNTLQRPFLIRLRSEDLSTIFD